MLQSKVNVKTLDQRYRAVRFHLGDIMECVIMCCVMLLYVLCLCRVVWQTNPTRGPVLEKFLVARAGSPKPQQHLQTFLWRVSAQQILVELVPHLSNTRLSFVMFFCQALAHPYSRFKISVSCSTIVLLNASSACRRIRKGCDQLTVLS